MNSVEQLLQPAVGFLQLGMLEDANDEIEALPPELKTDKVVLGIRVLIYRGLSAWQLMREVSGYLAHEWPGDSQHWIGLAYATRRCRSIKEAEGILMKAAELHPSEPLIHFNLACYAAQTGNLAAARERLAKAVALDPDTRMMALEDPDLEPLWEELEKPESNNPD